MVRIGGLKSAGSGAGSGGSGPAFVGQVFSMCDITGTGLMAVSTHFDIPFISKRLNVPSGVVGACRLDLAYEHFKEKPRNFQFVPNSKQVKAASKLLKGSKLTDSGHIDGVPVFSAQNLDIAIATPDGVKWYTPYFFDKNILDNILEESVDQHFHSLIQSRHVQRRGDVSDDNFAAEIIEESAESIWEPGEVQDLMDEMGQPGIPLSVISKAAEMQLSYAVDKVLLGNRWLRKATGIQPKFPYMVDSFERRSAVSRSRALKVATCSANSDRESLNELPEQSASAKLGPENKDQTTALEQPDLPSPRRDWLRLPWLKPQCEANKEADSRFVDSPAGHVKEELQSSPLLPRITMVGIATTEPGQMSKASIKKTMEDLSKELEQEGQGNSASKSSGKCCLEDRDPLFVANVGDYYSSMSKSSSPRWLRGVHR
uniref:Tic22-like family protein n=1 Tax=Chenopodium quinoa TaxID=63459 RepID=A0A803M051_CHEQI